MATRKAASGDVPRKTTKRAKKASPARATRSEDNGGPRRRSPASRATS
jgi:hypothetical protein